MVMTGHGHAMCSRRLWLKATFYHIIDIRYFMGYLPLATKIDARRVGLFTYDILYSCNNIIIISSMHQSDVICP